MRTASLFTALVAVLFLNGCATPHGHRLDQPTQASIVDKNSIVVSFDENEVKPGDDVRIYETLCRPRNIRGGETIQTCRDSQMGTGRVQSMIDAQRANVVLYKPLVIGPASRFEKISNN